MIVGDNAADGGAVGPLGEKGTRQAERQTERDDSSDGGTRCPLHMSLQNGESDKDAE